MHHLYHLYHRQRHLLLCVLTPLLLAVVSPSTLVARPVAERAISAKTAAFHQPKTTSAASSTASNFEEDLDLRTPENPASTVNGLDYKYYEGFWNALPTFSTLTPTKTGTITSPTLTPAQRDYGYAMQFTGYVTVPTDGSYTFYVNSDDGSRLYLGSTMVVDNDGSHGDRELNGTIGLKAGTHAFTVAYFQNGGGQVLSVSYAGPNISKQLIPTSAYKRVSTAAANKAPVASAGSNQSVTLPTNTVTLNGSGTDADGTINAYMWSQVSGPSTASFNSKSVAAPNVTGLVAGTYLFSLVVADNQGALSEAAQVSVVVSSASGLRTPENPASTVAGLDYKYYEGIWEALPPFSTMTPIKTGTVTAPTLTPQRRDYGYAMQFEGYVTVPTDGQYTFYLNSDDGSRLYLGSTLVVDNDGSHGDREIASVIGLKAGTHALTIGYLQGYGGQNLAVSYAGPGFAKQIIPASAYKRVSTTGANQSPVAVAGTNQSITLPTNTVTLTGSGTDSDGTVASYTWSQVSGPTVATFSSKTTASPSVSGLVAGSYVFSLVVADNQGALSNAAQVTVTVNANNTLRVPENPTGTVAGLNYKYYEGFWDMVPDFSTLTPLKTGASTAFELTPQVRDYGFSFQFTGYITVPTDGQYTFYANSDDGSLLYLGSTLVVNNDGSHGDREIASTIGLKAGTHAFTVAYLQGFGGQNLQISYAGPGFTKRLVPASALSRLSGTAPVNKAPVASAGDAKTITLPTNSLTLSGAGTDADGTISSFLWSQVSGPNTAAFNNNTVAQPVVSGLVAGSYIFSLVVTDNQSMKSAPAQVTITVANGNSCQVASPGVTTPVTYCQGAAANSLSSSVTLASGATLKIYTAATGGTALASDFKPATPTVGSTTYYVSQVS
ncbi:MAG TPA: PA14 domain-containing protein, partial [Hymenobacter sp.]